MNETALPWVILAITVVLGLGLLLVALWRRQSGETIKTDYRTLALMGLPLFAAGIAIDNPGIWALGLIYFILGVSHKDEWEDSAVWGQRLPGERERWVFLMFALAGLVAFAALAYLYAR